MACDLCAAVDHADDAIGWKHPRIVPGNRRQVGWCDLETGNVGTLTLRIHAVTDRAMHLEFLLADIGLFFLSDGRRGERPCRCQHEDSEHDSFHRFLSRLAIIADIRNWLAGAP